MEKDLTETWRPVKDYPLYQVSNYGRVKSFWTGKWVILKGKCSQGYVRHTLVHMTNKQVSTHRLVLEAFVGPCPDGLQCNHKDGIKNNNFLGNLEWVTSKQNNLHARQIGLWSPPRKLTWDNIKVIKKLRAKKYALKVIASVFNVHESLISKICSNQRWTVV